MWKDVFKNKVDVLSEHFIKKGEELFKLYSLLNSSTEKRFYFTQRQENDFNLKFSENSNVYSKLQGSDFKATIRRLGLSTFRIAMVLSVVRSLSSDNIPTTIICDNRDFENALHISDVLLIHASTVFATLPNNSFSIKPLILKDRLYLELPNEFSRQNYLEVARELGIADKTSENYITQFVKVEILAKLKHNTYLKTPLGNVGS